MKTAAKRGTPFRARFWRTSRRTTRVCPDCRARYEGLGCYECGWVADTSVACGGSEALREGKAIA